MLKEVNDPEGVSIVGFTNAMPVEQGMVSWYHHLSLLTYWIVNQECPETLSNVEEAIQSGDNQDPPKDQHQPEATSPSFDGLQEEIPIVGCDPPPALKDVYVRPHVLKNPWHRGHVRPLVKLISQAYPPFRKLGLNAKTRFIKAYTKEETAWKDEYRRTLFEHESRAGRKKRFTNKSRADRENELNDFLARYLTVKEQQAWFKNCHDIATFKVRTYTKIPAIEPAVDDDDSECTISLFESDSEDELDRRIRILKKEEGTDYHTAYVAG